MRNPYDAIGRIGLLLAILGAVNWLLVGLFEWNAAQWIFTQSGTQTVDSLGERIVYIVVGAGGILAIPMLAATLARSRRAGYDEASATGERDDLRTDDMAYYSGAPKQAPAGRRAVAETSMDTPSSSTLHDESPETLERGPVRKTERVIIRTEEPLTGRESAGVRSVRDEPSATRGDRDLSYGPVEEADDEYGDEYRRDERRAA